jgi:type IV pilus assembly protein PilE
MNMNSEKGFTLIEMMITVVILGILAAVAFQTYQSSVRNSNRTEGKAEVMDVAQRLQSCYTVYGRYNHDSCAIYAQLSAAGGKITTQSKGFYDVTGVFAAGTYTLTATAVKLPQTADTGCLELFLTHTGAKTPAGCW